MRNSIFVLLLLVLNCSLFSQEGISPQDKQLYNYLLENHSSPEDYIIKKFKDHQVIFIGENHRIKHDVELIQNILPLLYTNGIYTLAIEFATAKDQPLIDSLITAPAFNQKLAERILFNELVTWGYKEYADIFRAAWQLNKYITGKNRKFRILGINCTTDWSVIKTEDDLKNVEMRKKVWNGCGEKDWADVIIKEIVDKNEKGLVYCGAHHAFTEYMLPIYSIEKDTLYRFEDDRVGRYVYNKIGKQAFTIFLHAPWDSDKRDNLVQPAGGKIEEIISTLPKEYQRAGFDVKDSPFGELKSTNSYYKYGYPNFCLGDFCGGYIYQKPIKEYETVTMLDDFINEDNIAAARVQSPDPEDRNYTTAQFREEMKQGLESLKKKFIEVK